MFSEITIATCGQGLHEITDEVSAKLRSFKRIDSGLCNLFIQHTSASLLIQENADPSAKKDLERWLNRLVPESDPHFTHTAEGPDDMPSHIKAALTCTNLTVPVIGGELALGTWQGIYLWEHRRSGSTRKVMITVVSSG